MNKTALKLPDALLVRYYREGRDADIKQVTVTKDGWIKVTLNSGTVETWRDLGGGLGFVPNPED